MDPSQMARSWGAQLGAGEKGSPSPGQGCFPHRGCCGVGIIAAMQVVKMRKVSVCGAAFSQAPFYSSSWTSISFLFSPDSTYPVWAGGVKADPQSCRLGAEAWCWPGTAATGPMPLLWRDSAFCCVHRALRVPCLLKPAHTDVLLPLSSPGSQ